MIRTSGYYKQKGIGEELVDNSEFEEGMENWVWYGWNKVEWIDKYHNEPALKCTFKAVLANVRYDSIIEVNPEDIMLMGITVEEPSTSFPVRFGLFRYDKFGYHIGSNEWYYTVTPTSATCTTVYRLFAISEQLSKYEGWQSVIRGVLPSVMCSGTDGWNENDVLNIKSISLRRVNPDKLKTFPVSLIDINTNNPSLNTNYYGEKYFTGIFKEADYLLYIDRLENAGGNDITLQVSIESYDVTTQKWFTSVIFDDVVVQSEPVTNQTQVKVATAGLGFYQRVRWYIKDSGGGGDADQWRFKVGVTYKQ